MQKRKIGYKFQPCPDLRKGVRCPVCGGSYICLEPWRKRLVNGKKSQEDK